MPRNEDYKSDSEVHDIMEKFVERLPGPFKGFEVDCMQFVMTCKKTNLKTPIKLHAVGYPNEVFVGHPYIVEIFQDTWVTLTPKQKNLLMFHVMCILPDGAFDPASKYYGKKVPPQIVMYHLEFAASGGIPNWRENDKAAMDPMEADPDDMALAVAAAAPQEVEGEDPIPADEPSGKHPVTAADVAEMGKDEAAA